MEAVLSEIEIERYNAYKDSGIEWLGDMPEHWEMLANKYIFRLKKNQVGRKSGDFVLLSLTLNGVIKRDMENPQGKFPAEFNTYQEVKSGDFIFCLFDVEETPRAVGLSDYDGMITGAYTVLEPSKEFDKKFLYYFYLNIDSDKRMRSLYKGLRNTIPKESFFSFKTFAPPKEEQTAITNFLDRKTGLIDKAIAIKEKQIELLKERRQILIHRAVTRGLNPNVKMKDSGVEWIGEIPEHWEVVRSKTLFLERKERARTNDIQLTSSQKFGVIPQATYMQIEGRRVTQVEFNREIQKHVEKGDFMISMRSFQGGIEYSEYEGCISSAYVPLIPNELVVPSYYKYLLKSPRYIAALQSTSNLVRDGQALRFDNFKQVDLIRLPKDEQNAIASFIRKHNDKTEKAITLKEQEIERLKEYKSSLINSAVTGKIKVC